VKRITASVRKVTDRPLIAKLSPNVSSITAVAGAALEGGADALTVANTLLGMSVDWRARTPRLNTGYGGLSGPAVMPVILRMVHQVWREFQCPVIASGGASSADDVMDYIVCGASAVQVGTANFMDPMAVPSIIAELKETLSAEGIATLRECTGTLLF
jgi:dihydroorotate dehydrogenase (NAD+) catalytic subunit